MNISKKTDTVVTRFAPSPTGFLHIGAVRTALYAYLYAKKYNGKFILRIEDTDKNREVEGSIKHIMESLKWLGIDWDYGPDQPGDFKSCLQSDRLEVYKKYAKILVDKGLAYPDVLAESEVEAYRAQAKEEGRAFLFREHRPDKFDSWDGTQTLRFKVPEIKRYEWQDAVRGKLSAGPEMLDDFVLIKSDGFPTYNFAHVIDDYEMGVTHVMRGEEFISSTPKFISLHEALEIELPILATLPPIMGPDGKKKLSKRDGAKDLLEYRTDGYLPEAMRNFLALIGWNPGGNDEIFPSNESENKLVELFSLEKIQRSGGAFNEEKLKWMNKVYLSNQNQDWLNNYVLEAIPDSIKSSANFSKETINKITPTILEKNHNQTEIKESFETDEYEYLFNKPDYSTEILKWKKDPSLENTKTHLKKVYTLMKSADFTNKDDIKEAVWKYAEEEGRGEVLWPLRVSLSGREQSPDPFTLAYSLGQTETLERIQTAYDKIGE